MRIAYLLNSYPMTSTTFIRREIEALEELGVPVTRYAVRPWADQLVDDRDIAEIARTHYLLVGNLGGLFLALLQMIFTAPARLLRGAAMTLRLLRRSKREFVRHGAYFLQAVYLLKRARADGIDHIHVHFATNAAAVALIVRVMGGPSYSFTSHGPDEFTDAPRLSFPEKIEQAKFVVAISNFCRQQLIRFSSHAFTPKIHVIRCGLFLNEYSAAAAPASESFVCIGRLSPQKAQALIPPAMKAVRAEFPQAKALLIGDGPDRGKVEAAVADAGVNDMVALLGWRANREAIDLLGNARALLLPTNDEGLPIVIMEAFALGRPVIATSVAGIPELVDASCGWLVPLSDANSLAAAMREALGANAATLAALGAEGRRRVEKLHDQRANARELKRLLMD